MHDGNFNNTMTLHTIAAGSTVVDLADALQTNDAREAPVVVDTLGREANPSVDLVQRFISDMNPQNCL